MATKDQRDEFVLIFKDSLLDNYASTLAKWGDSTITTIYPRSENQSDFEKMLRLNRFLIPELASIQFHIN